MPNAYQSLVAELAELNPAALTADGLELGLLGYTLPYFRDSLAVYDVDRCLAILQERDGMSAEGAAEFFEFNTAGAWAGNGTPLYVRTLATPARFSERPQRRKRPR